MEPEHQNVVITNIKIPFFSLVWFMIKWVFALIPAVLLIGVLGFGLMIAEQMFGISETLHALL